MNNGVSTGKTSSSSSSSSSSAGASYEAMKRHHISELKRFLTIRNECMNIRKSTNLMHDHGFIDDREKEAFTAFNALLDNAEPGLISDPDVLKVIEELNHGPEEEDEDEFFGLLEEELSMRVGTAKEAFIMGLKVGKEVRIVGGRDIGKKGKILEVRKEDERVRLRLLNGEETVVWVGSVANLRSPAEDMCLLKLMDGNGNGKEMEDMEFMEMMQTLNIIEKGIFGKK